MSEKNNDINNDIIDEDSNNTEINNKGSETKNNEFQEPTIRNTEYTKEEDSVSKQISKNKNNSKEGKKKKNIFVRFLLGIAGFILGLIIVIAGWFLYSAIARDSVESHFEDSFIGYVNIPSVSKFFDEMLYLSAIDAILADSALSPAQNLISSLRSNEILKRRWLKFLTNIRLDAAFYTTESPDKIHIRAIADLGFRSGITRLSPLALKLMPGILDNLPEITVENDERGQYFIYPLPTGDKIFIRAYKNLIIAEFISDKTKFAKSTQKNDGKTERALKRNLKKAKKKTLNILADANILKDLAPKNDPILTNLMTELSFEGLSVINLDILDNNIVLNGEAKWKSTSTELQEILRTRGSVPKILKKLPDTTEYFTLLNINTPENLWKNLQPFLDEKTKKTYQTANKMAKLVLKQPIDKIIFSWMGKELGVFAIENIKDPVFFAEIKDFKSCNTVFEKIFKTIFVDKESSAIIDDIRISRIVFPHWITGLLKIFKIELPRPFYFIEKDFIVFSNSSEAIAAYKTSKTKLTKNKKWQSAIKNISPETSIFMYYNLERSIPFFLQGQRSLYSILQKYGQGLFSFKFASDDKIKIDFFAIKTSEKPLKAVTGFPKDLSEKANGNIHCAKTKAGTPFAFWTHKETILAMNLATGSVQKIATDAEVKITLEIKNNKLDSVWALTKAGTVYKMNSDLKSDNGFPIITSTKAIKAPVLTGNGIVFASGAEPKLCFISKQGEITESFEMHTKMKTSPICFEDKVIALPRSFESTVYIFNTQGEFEEEISNIELDSISAVQPVVFKNKKGETLIANITEEGMFSLHQMYDNISNERQIITNQLDSACKTQPVYSENLHSIFLISENSFLKQLDERGNVINAIPLKTGRANNYAITLYDITKDGIDEIFISGAGNSIYAYNSSLEEIPGFPIPGANRPYFIDVTGDGNIDIITYGIDNKIYACSGGKK